MEHRRSFRSSLGQRKRFGTVLAVLLLTGGLWFFQNHGRCWALRTPPERSRPKITFVIDDIGEHDRFKAELTKLGPKVTYAILPLRDYSGSFSEQAERTHNEVILHLPLETVRTDQFPGQGLITERMDDNEILSTLRRDLASVPGRIGVNNHMGSKGTSNRRVMTIILKELQRERLFFLDSHTTSRSVAPEICHAIGLPFSKCGLFLDNDGSVEGIKAKLTELRRIARESGSAIAIGHYTKKTTLDVLAEEIPRLEQEGFEIISLKDSLKIHTD